MSVTALSPADALLEEAQRANYRYPPLFGGFEATLVSTAGGAEAVQIGVRVDGDGVVAEGQGPIDAWALEQIRSMVAHRLGRPYSLGDGRHQKRIVEDSDPLGTLVEIEDGMSSSYRLADGQITLVTRQPGPRRFSIAMQDRLEVQPGVFLPKEFSVFFWDADGELDASEAYSDSYAEVDSLLLPARRRVIRADSNGVTTQQLTLTRHTLFEENAS